LRILSFKFFSFLFPLSFYGFRFRHYTFSGGICDFGDNDFSVHSAFYEVEDIEVDISVVEVDVVGGFNFSGAVHVVVSDAVFESVDGVVIILLLVTVNVEFIIIHNEIVILDNGGIPIEHISTSVF
jgi:hypothetical protein